MAAYSSTTSGLWNDKNVWGGSNWPSASGDTFTINTGHTVIYNLTDTSSCPNGFGTSNLYGKLEFATGSNTVLKMYGSLNIRTAGSLIASSSAPFQIYLSGSDANAYGIVQYAEASNKIILYGPPGNPETSMSVQSNPEEYYIDVYDGTGFAIGDWISLHPRNVANEYLNRRDEGVLIQDISSSNRFFIREFVGPTASLVSDWDVNTNMCSVSNANIFRKGYKIIAGTGSFLFTGSIAELNTSNNSLTMSNNVRATLPAGTVLYTSGLHKLHYINETVTKIATFTTSSNLSANTTVIPVGHIGSITTGDNIFIENSQYTDNAYDLNTLYTVSSVNTDSNTITISPGLTSDLTERAMVARLTRTSKIIGLPNTRCYIYGIYYTSNYTRAFVMDNLEVQNLGNSNSSYYRGIIPRGYYEYTTDNLGPRIDGCTFWSSSYSYNADYGGITSVNVYFFTIRNCIVHNYYNGIRIITGYWTGIFNNISTNNYYANYIFSVALYEDSEFSYNYGHRARSYNLVHESYDVGRGINYNKFNICQNYCFYKSTYSPSVIFQNEFLHYRYRPYIFPGQSALFVNCYFNSPVLETVDRRIIAGTSFSSPYRNLGRSGGAYYFDYNYDPNIFEMSSFNICKRWMNDIGCWRIWRRHDDSSWCGFAEDTYLPANCSLSVEGSIQMVNSAFAGTYPFLRVADQQCNYRLSTNANPPNYNTYAGPMTSSRYNGDVKQTSFTSISKTDFETVTITINPQPYPRVMISSIISNSSNASEGWYEKPLKVTISGSRIPNLPLVMDFTNNNSQTTIDGQYIQRYLLRLNNVRIV